MKNNRINDKFIYNDFNLVIANHFFSYTSIIKLIFFISLFIFSSSLFFYAKANPVKIVYSDTTITPSDFFIVDTTAKISIGNGTSLQVFGHLVNNGSFIGSGKLSLGGNSMQMMMGTGNINNLITDNPSGIVISDGSSNMQNIITYLQLKSGILYTSDNLTLKSDSNITASVGPVTGGIIGNVIAEKYIPAKKTYYLLTSAVTTPTSIHNNWQEGAISNTDNPNPGYGTHITGSTIDQQNGFDGTNSGNPSMFLFDVNNTNTWTPLSNTNSNTFSSGYGYKILIQGDRSIDLTNSNAVTNATVLRAKGALTVGPVFLTSNSSPALGIKPLDFSLLGNPYASAINWDQVSKNYIGQTYYRWDPTLMGNSKMGAFVAYNSVTGMSNNGASSFNANIPSGAAFFVQTSGNNPSLTFDETNKVIPSTRNGNNTSPIQITLPKISFQLFVGNNQNNTISADGAVVAYNTNYSTGLSDEDAIKLDNPDENIAVKSNAKLLTIEGRPSISYNDSIQLYLYNLQPLIYNLQVNVTALNNVGANEAFLVDKLAGVEYPLNTTSSNINVAFVATPNNLNSDRFYVIFNKNSGFPVSNPNLGLPITVTVPSPVISTATVTYSLPQASNFSIKLLSVDGKLLYEKNFPSQQQGQISIPMSQYSQGFYLVEFMVGDKKINRRVFKQ